MSKFKIGDRVRVVKNTGNHFYDMYIGKQFTVLKVYSQHITIDATDMIGTKNTVWQTEELELVEKESKLLSGLVTLWYGQPISADNRHAYSEHPKDPELPELSEPQKSLLKTGDKLIYGNRHACPELPEPQKSLLKTGDKLIYGDGKERFVLLETGYLYDVEGKPAYKIELLFEDLMDKYPTTNQGVREVYRNGQLVMLRTKKSERQLRIEDLQARKKQLEKEMDEVVRLMMIEQEKR
jgi:hypothetical protein